MLVPGDIEEEFLSLADRNTSMGIETCGILCGILNASEVIVTDLVIPPQKGTYNTVEMLNDELVALHLIDNGLHTIGWIHTHPTQTAF